MSRIAALSSTAPLMAIPESRPPEGGVGEWFRGAGGLRLRLGFWQPKGVARGTVFVSPGRSEPIEKYYEVVSDLLARRFCVVVHDWRGQGLSARLLPDRLKGHARSTEEFLDDYQRLLDGFEDRAPKPWIMMGHSMGAALNLSTLIKGEERFGAAIFINPMLRIKTGKHSLWSVSFQTDWKVRHGQGTDYVPELFDDPFEHTFEDDALCHDEHRYNIWREQLFACPHLAIGTPTWGWLNFAFKIGETLLKDKGKLVKKIRTPVSIICSGDDTLMMKQPSKTFAKRLPKGHYVEVPGADHEILMELDEYRRPFWAEFDAMVESTVPAPVTFASLPVSDAATRVVESAPVPVSAEVFDSHVPEKAPPADPAVEGPQDNLSVVPPVKAEGDVTEPTPAVPKPALFVAYELSDVPTYAPPLESAEEIEVVDWEEAVSAEKVEPDTPAKPDDKRA